MVIEMKRNNEIDVGLFVDNKVNFIAVYITFKVL